MRLMFTRLSKRGVCHKAVGVVSLLASYNTLWFGWNLVMQTSGVLLVFLLVPAAVVVVSLRMIWRGRVSLGELMALAAFYLFWIVLWFLSSEPRTLDAHVFFHSTVQSGRSVQFVPFVISWYAGIALVLLTLGLLIYRVRSVMHDSEWSESISSFRTPEGRRRIAPLSISRWKEQQWVGLLGIVAMYQVFVFWLLFLWQSPPFAIVQTLVALWALTFLIGMVWNEAVAIWRVAALWMFFFGWVVTMPLITGESLLSASKLFRPQFEGDPSLYSVPGAVSWYAAVAMAFWLPRLFVRKREEQLSLSR